jgi:hypothetical protein
MKNELIKQSFFFFFWSSKNERKLKQQNKKKVWKADDESRATLESTLRAVIDLTIRQG